MQRGTNWLVHLDFIDLLTCFDIDQLIELAPYKPTYQVDVRDKFI